MTECKNKECPFGTSKEAYDCINNASVAIEFCKEFEKKLVNIDIESVRVNGIASKALTISETIRDQKLDTKIKIIEEWRKTVENFHKKVEPRLDELLRITTRNQIVDRIMWLVVGVVVSGLIGLAFYHIRGN